MEELKRFLVSFEVVDGKTGRSLSEDCLEEVFAESEDEAIELVRQWVIDQSVQDGFDVDVEDTRYVDGIHVTGGKYDDDADQEYGYFRVVEQD